MASTNQAVSLSELIAGKRAIIYTVAEKTIVSKGVSDKEQQEKIDRELAHNIQLLKHFAEHIVGIHPNHCAILTDSRRLDFWQDSKKKGFSMLMDAVLLGDIRDIIVKHSGELSHFQDDMLAMVFEKMSVRLHILEYHKESALSYYEDSFSEAPLSILVHKESENSRPFASSKNQITSIFQKTDTKPLDKIADYKLKFDHIFENSKANVFREEDIQYLASEILNNGTVSMLRMQEIQQFFAMGSLRFTPDYGVLGIVNMVANYQDSAVSQSKVLEHVGFAKKFAESLGEFFEFAKEQSKSKKPDYAELSRLYFDATKLNQDAPHTLKVISVLMSSLYYDYRSMSGILASTKAYRDMLVNLYQFFKDPEKLSKLPITQKMGENYLKHQVENIQKDLIRLLTDTDEYLTDATILYHNTENYLSHFHESLLLFDNYRRKWAMSMVLSLLSILDKESDSFLMKMVEQLNQVVAEMGKVTAATSEFKRESIDKRFNLITQQTANYLDSKTKNA